MTIKEDKVMYMQHNQGRVEDVDVAVTVVAEIVVVEATMKRKDKRTNKTGMAEVTIIEEVIVLII